jgi:hypothetical protein
MRVFKFSLAVPGKCQEGIMTTSSPAFTVIQFYITLQLIYHR